MLRSAGLLETPVVAEVFTRKSGVFAGLEEVLRLFRTFPAPPEVELFPGIHFEGKEVLMRITGTYESFGLYETVLLGMLASSTGWATAAGNVWRQRTDAMCSVSEQGMYIPLLRR